MKILMISSDNNPTSGAFLSEVKLCQLLSRVFHHEIHVILPKDGDGKLLLDEVQIPYSIIPSYDWVIPIDAQKNVPNTIKQLGKRIFNYYAICKIANYAKKNGYDIIHINTTYAYVGAKAALLAKKPFVWHLREYLEDGQARTLWNRPKGNQLLEKANRLICISSSIYIKYLPVLLNAKFSIIPNGIDTDIFFRPKHLIFTSDIITLIYGGGYSIRKGVYDLAKACHLLKKKGIYNFRLLCIGNTTEKFQKYIANLELNEIVEFLGYQKDPIQWYEQSDIALNCSVFEGFGRTTVEGMLAGNLIIASDSGGTLDIIKPYKTGLLYHQGDAKDLAQKIEYAILNQSEMRKIAKFGQSYARNQFSALKNAESINALYQNVLSETIK